MVATLALDNTLPHVCLKNREVCQLDFHTGKKLPSIELGPIIGDIRAPYKRLVIDAQRKSTAGRA